MLNWIIKNDWRNLRADRTLWAVAILLGCVIAYGVHNGAAWVNFQKETIQRAMEEESTRLQALRKGIDDANAGRTNPPSFRDPRSPFSVGYTMGGRYAFLPPGPLAPLAVGQSDLLPYYFKVSLRSRDTIIGNDEIENPVHLLSGRFDLAFAIIYLFPLLILALSYNLISSEKEDGTLAMTLSQPVSLRTLAAGKIALRGLFVISVATAISIAAALFSGVNLAAEGALPRFLLWIVAVAAYGAFWFALAVAVNALGRGSSTNAVALAGMWLVFVLLVPALLNVAVKAVHPVPSRVEMIQAMREAGDDVTRTRSKLLAKYLEDHPELVPATKDSAQEFAVRSVAIMEEMERRVQPVLARFETQLAQQQDLVDHYRFLSPAVLMQSALYDLAGTNVFRYKHFAQLTQEFHREWSDHFSPLVARSVKLTPASIDAMPKFAYREEAFPDVLARVGISLAGLLGLAAIAAFAAIRGMRNYPMVG